MTALSLGVLVGWMALLVAGLALLVYACLSVGSREAEGGDARKGSVRGAESRRPAAEQRR